MYTISMTTTVTTALPPQLPATFDSTKALIQVADAFGVPTALITGKCRRHEVVMARWIFWLILYRQKYTYAQCGRMAHGYNHSSVVHALQHVHHEIVHDVLARRGYESIAHLLPSSEQTLINQLITDHDNGHNSQSA